jgi:GH35 family endo-1,4-beta-xylanase
MTRFVFCIFLLMCLSADAAKLPSGGDETSFDREFMTWGVVGRQHKTVVKEVRSVSRMPFKKCIELELTERTAGPYDIQFNGKVTGQIKKGDVLLCSFYMRCPESSDESALGKFTVGSNLKRNGRYYSPFTKTYTVGSKWKHFTIPFVAPVPNDVGYNVGFRLGGVKPQTLQVADFKVLNYGSKRTVSELPATETRYDGMEPDAPWRQAANKRIREHRMENLKVQVVDDDGQPIEGAEVQLKLKNHAYGFGVALGLNAMFNERRPEDARAYRDAVEELFNKAVFENRMKWKFYQDNDTQLEKAIAWCKERNIPLRGHVMVWPAWQRLPKGMQAEWGTRTNEFRTVIEDHVRKMSTQYPDTFAEWDIVNELYSQHEFVDMLGDEVVVDWFNIAKESDPNFKRYINDYGILSGSDQAHQDNYYNWINYLMEQGAAVDGIGLQGHFRAPVPPEEILKRLDRFASFGLELQITEYDFEDTDELLQARYTRDFMTAVFSHPSTTGIMTWCLWESAAWKPTAAFFSSDWKKKRIAQAWEHMIKTEWHTDFTSRTNTEGLVGIRGYLGEYEITIQHNGKKVIRSYVLEKGAAVHVVSLNSSM